MRVIVFTDSYWPRVNGLSVAVDGMADAIRARGHNVMVVCPRYKPGQGSPESAPVDGTSGPDRVLRLASVDAVFSSEDRYCPTMGRSLLWRQLDEFGADLIHVQSEFSVGGLGRRYARARRIPLVATCHTSWEDYAQFYFSAIPARLAKWIGRHYMRATYRHDRVITVPTQPMAEQFRGYGFGRRLRLLSSGVDAGRFSINGADLDSIRLPLWQRFPRLPKGPVLLFAGRVVREKNLAFLLRAFARVLKQRPDASLLVVGDGAYRADMEREAKEMGVDQACCFAGYAPFAEMPKYYRLATVFVFPSLTETQGLVTIEAMLSGLPVVAIGAMGTLDVMGGDNGGFMVGEDEAEFADRTLDLLNDPELHARKKTDAIARGTMMASANAMGRFVDLYEEVLSGGN